MASWEAYDSLATYLGPVSATVVLSWSGARASQALAGFAGTVTVLDYVDLSGYVGPAVSECHRHDGSDGHG